VGSEEKRQGGCPINVIEAKRHRNLTITARGFNVRLPRRCGTVNRHVPGTSRSRCDVTCKSLSPVCNAVGCIAKPPMVRIRILGDSSASGPRLQAATTDRPRTAGVRYASSTQGQSRERANAACHVFFGGRPAGRDRCRGIRRRISHRWVVHSCGTVTGYAPVRISRAAILSRSNSSPSCNMPV
jgi:hypothetical protein